MLEIMQSVCRKCKKVYPLVAGVVCPECHGSLVMVRFVEAAEQSVHPTASGAGDFTLIQHEIIAKKLINKYGGG